ncbi:MAG: fluoride efflux transporter CrcB [Euryarchaeota archaeon]|nr:fluoride efflux transporter CrcB [Euryarchaeota archaeon]
MQLWLLIGIGGFFGSIFRFVLSGWLQNGLSFPLGTLGVNFIGSFILGLVMYLSEFRGLFSEEMRIFLAIGLLGGFTTMSTFSYESFRLLEQGETSLFTLNVTATVVLTILAVYLGKVAVINLGGG